MAIVALMRSVGGYFSLKNLGPLNFFLGVEAGVIRY